MKNRKAFIFFITFPIVFCLSMLSFFMFSYIMDQKLTPQYETVKITSWMNDSFTLMNKNDQSDGLINLYYISVLFNNNKSLHIKVNKDWYLSNKDKISMTTLKYRHGYMWHIDNYDIR